MDPDAALRRFLDACNEWQTAPTADACASARDEALEALGDLRKWINIGGFLPADPRKGNEP